MVAWWQTVFKKLLANSMKDIPIKKRKLWNRSVSPPPQTCLQTAGEPEQLSDGPGEVRNGEAIGYINFRCYFL